MVWQLMFCFQKRVRLRKMVFKKVRRLSRELWWTGSPVSELVRSNPRVMKAGEHREDKEGECFVRFGHGGGLSPSSITVKVRTCGERKRFGFGSHRP